MPGRTVTELERRYGRAGTEVLDSLRGTAEERRPDRGRRRRPGRGRARPAARARQRRRLVLRGSRSHAARAPPCPGLRRHGLLRGHRRQRTWAPSRRRSARRWAASPTTAAARCSRSTASATATAGRPPSTARSPARARTSSTSSRARPRGATPRSRCRAQVDEPVVLAGLVGSGPGARGRPGRRSSRTADRERVSREVAASGLRGRGGAGFPAARQVGRGGRGAERRAPLSDLQRRRGRPGLVRRPAADGARPAPRARGHGAGRARRRRRRTASSTCAPSTRAPATRCARPSAEARAAGHLGDDVHGTGLDFDVEVFEGAGSYVAGEETSLIHSMEGLRGEVAGAAAVPDRARLPRPADGGQQRRDAVRGALDRRPRRRRLRPAREPGTAAGPRSSA